MITGPPDSSEGDRPALLNAGAIQTIRDWLAKKSGLDPASLGVGWLESLLERRRIALGCASLLEYSGRLFLLPDEQRELVQATLVHESWFFRDPAAFTSLRAQVRAHQHSGRILMLQPFRVLSLPCAAGEEAYSIAMELTDAGLESREFRVEAADLSADAVERARTGRFRDGSVRGASLPKLERYISRDAEGILVRESIRASVTFRVENALEPSSLRRLPPFDAIFCRNMLVYLTATARSLVVENLISLLRPDGILYFGHADADPATTQKLAKTSDRGAFAYRLKRELPTAAISAPTPAPAPPVRTPEPPPTASIPSPKEDLFAEATRLADAGRVPEALLIVEQLTRIQPLHADAWRLRGILLHGRGDAQRAEESLRKAVYLDPGNDDALLHLALLLEDEGRLEEAGRVRRRLRRSNPAQA